MSIPLSIPKLPMVNRTMNLMFLTLLKIDFKIRLFIVSMKKPLESFEPAISARIELNSLLNAKLGRKVSD